MTIEDRYQKEVAVIRFCKIAVICVVGFTAAAPLVVNAGILNSLGDFFSRHFGPAEYPGTPAPRSGGWYYDKYGNPHYSSGMRKPANGGHATVPGGWGEVQNCPC